MRTATYKQCVLCAGATMAESVRIFNEQMKELGQLKPTYERIDGGFLIYFNETALIPESLADKMELKGEIHVCEECSHCQWPKNRHGLEDKRVKKTMCHRSIQLINKDTQVCDIFYEEGQHKKLYLDIQPREETEKIRA